MVFHGKFRKVPMLFQKGFGLVVRDTIRKSIHHFYARNWNLTMAFWAIHKIAQPIKPIQHHFFTLPWFTLKKPSWELIFLHIFAYSLFPWNCCQITFCDIIPLYYFVTSKKNRNHQFTNFKPFLMLYKFLFITLKNIFSIAFSFE